MKLDLEGRVRNIQLPKSQPLLPLFEAIVNSIHAIEDLGREDGQIAITILRSPQEVLALPGQPAVTPSIIGFKIEDSGVGFTNANFQAFETADTRWKQLRGGKGVGRFLWLKCFRRALVDSIFADEGVPHRRKFTFSLTSNGIADHDLQTCESSKLGTTILLDEILDEYAEHIPQQAETIANRVIEHCLEFFVLNRMPQTSIVDPRSGDDIDLLHMYHASVANTAGVTLTLGDHTFRLDNFLIQSRTSGEHKINLCAHHRVVRSEKVQSKIPNLPSKFDDSEHDRSTVYAGYVTGEYLDAHVNQQRTDFDFTPGPLIAGELDLDTLHEAVLEQATAFLHPYTEPVKAEKVERIARFVQEEAPEYRYLLRNYPDRLDRISPTTSVDKFHMELFRIHHEIEVALRQRGQRLLQEAKSVDLSNPVFQKKLAESYEEYLADWNEVGKSDLARYVVKRKVMLSFLEDALNRQADGKYLLENVIHAMIFPLRQTSDEVNFERQNLWVIDERLAFHYYLASDKPLRQVAAINVDSSDRPDIIIFDRPIAAADESMNPYSAVVIFEFKRPMRNQYDEDNNPIDQVLNYVQTIRQGDAVDKRGRPLLVTEATPFYCYVLCDMTPKVKSQAQRAGLQETPDRLGFLGYNPSLKAYVEVISYEKLLNDAKKRNQILFEKLRLR